MVRKTVLLGAMIVWVVFLLSAVALAAQPKMFVSFSQKSAEGESLRELVAPYSGSGQTAGSAVGGMGQRFQAKSAVGVSAKAVLFVQLAPSKTSPRSFT